MNLKQIIEKLDTLYYVVDSVSRGEKQAGLFIFFSQYKSILGQCNKVCPKEAMIKKMLLNTFNIRTILHHSKDLEAKHALQNEIKILINLVRNIEQIGKPPLLRNQLVDHSGKLNAESLEYHIFSSFSGNKR